MLKETTTTWTAKRLVKEVSKGGVVFDSAVQRGYVWDIHRKSLLIDSILQGYPIPSMYGDKKTVVNEDTGKEVKIIDMLDGKQRSNAIVSYINDEFALSKVVDEIDCEEEGDKISIEGLKFSELPEEFRDRITDYNIQIRVFDDLEDEQRDELFRRINNGKPLTAIELTRVKAKSLPIIQRIGSHEIFTHSLTAKAFEKYAHEDIVTKAYATLFTDEPSYETKKIRPLMETIEITEEQEQTLTKCFDKILSAYTMLKEKQVSTPEKKRHERLCKKMLTKTHLLSLLPLANRDDVTVANLAEFCLKFFDGGKSTSISKEYNENASRATGRTDNILSRLHAIEENYAELIEKKECKHENACTLDEDFIHTENADCFDEDFNTNLDWDNTDDVISMYEDMAQTIETESMY